MIRQTASATDFAKWEAQAREMDEAGLFYALNDCRKAAEAMKGWNPEREGYYADQAFTFADEIRRRRNERKAA
jgi:hypothetical protein